jgi:hypothetical protein
MDESVDHLLFHRPLTAFIWVVVRDGLRWKTIPQSVKNFNDDFLLEV